MELLVLAAALAAAAAVLLAVVGRPQLAIPLVVAVSVAMSSGLDRPVARAGAVSFFLGDLLTGVLLAVLLLQFGAGRRFHRAALPWSLLLALVVLGLARGVNEFGLERSFNSFRSLSVLVVTGLYFSAQVLSRTIVLSILRRSLLAASVLLAGIAGLYVARYGLNRFGVMSADGTPDRPLNAPQATIVMASMLLLLALDRRRLDRWWAAGCAALLVVSQQRTVWIASLLGLIALGTTMSENHQLRRRLATTAVATGVAALITVVAVPSSSFSSALRRAVQEPFAQNGTFLWRVEGWRLLVNRQLHGPLLELWLGTAAGTGSTRRLPSALGGGLVTVSAHSQWVTELLVGGLVALTLFAVATVVPTFQLWSKGVGSERGDPLLPLAVSALVFSISYQLEPPQSLYLGLVGVAASLAKLRPNQRPGIQFDLVGVSPAVHPPSLLRDNETSAEVKAQVFPHE